jgi:hypothetical protein
MWHGTLTERGGEEEEEEGKREERMGKMLREEVRREDGLDMGRRRWRSGWRSANWFGKSF